MLVHRSIVFLEVCLVGLQADIQCSSIGRGSFLVLEGAVITSTGSQLCHWGFGPTRVCVLQSVCSLGFAKGEVSHTSRFLFSAKCY